MDFAESEKVHEPSDPIAIRFEIEVILIEVPQLNEGKLIRMRSDRRNPGGKPWIDFPFGWDIGMPVNSPKMAKAINPSWPI